MEDVVRCQLGNDGAMGAREDHRQVPNASGGVNMMLGGLHDEK